MPAPYQHTRSTLQSCNLAVYKWALPHPPKAPDHPHRTDSQTTAPTAPQHPTTITHPETVLRPPANACSKAPTPHSLPQRSCNNNSAQPPTRQQNNPVPPLRIPSPSIHPLLQTQHPTPTKAPPTSPPHLPQHKVSSAQALTCKVRLYRLYLLAALHSFPLNTIRRDPAPEIAFPRRQWCRLSRR